MPSDTSHTLLVFCKDVALGWHAVPGRQIFCAQRPGSQEHHSCRTWLGNIAVCLELGTSAHSAHTENSSTAFSFTGNEAGGPWVLPSPSSELPHA